MRLLAALVFGCPVVSRGEKSVLGSVGSESIEVFDQPSPLAGNAEILGRLLSPLAAREVRRALARSGKQLADQAIDLGKERFVVFTPSRKPPQGYGLLVFVPPWRQAEIPPGWQAVLDERGVIFVSAANSGNDTNAVGRRVPLALLAEENIRRRYPVDPQKIYIGGFSGGSRVALRIALDYPDVFRRALLNAGSDPLGEGAIPIPTRDRLERFQALSRLVYVTGERDEVNLGMDASSASSMRQWCVTQIVSQRSAFVGHSVAGPNALARALDALAQPLAGDSGATEACRSRLQAGLDRRLEMARAMIAAGKRAEAVALLSKIDRRYGGLASPRLEELADRAAGS